MSSADVRKRQPTLTVWCQAKARKVVSVQFGQGENEMVKVVGGTGAHLNFAAQEQVDEDPAVAAVLDRLDRTMNLAASVPEHKLQEILALVGDLGDVDLDEPIEGDVGL